MRPKTVILLLVILLALTSACILGWFGPPASSGDIRALFPFSSPTLTALQRMETLFGESLFDSLLVTLPQEIDDETQEQLAELRDEIGGLAGVVSVISPVEGLSKLGIPIGLLLSICVLLGLAMNVCLLPQLLGTGPGGSSSRPARRSALQRPRDISSGPV